MDSEKLLKAMEYLDDELLLEADEPAEKSGKLIRIVVAAAACLLVCIIAFAAIKSQYRGSRQDKEIKIAVATEKIDNTPMLIIEETPAPTMNPDINVENVISENTNNEENLVVSASDIPVATPCIQVTAAPEVVTTPTPEAEKDNGNEDFVEEEFTTPAPVEPTPTLIPQPEEDNSWTETFAATDVRHSYGIDKSEAVYFVEQLYLSGSGAAPATEDEWWYGVKINDSMYIQAKVQVKNSFVESNITETVLKGVNKTDYISKETKAYVYKIKGVSADAAVAVCIEEQSGYYLFINQEYKVSTLQEFVTAYNLREFADVKALAVYDDWDKQIMESPDRDLIWDILLSGEGSKINENILYFDYDVSATIEVDVKMYGFIDVPIALYDEGYVMIYLGDIYGAYYIGTENVEAIKNLMDVS